MGKVKSCAGGAVVPAQLERDHLKQLRLKQTESISGDGNPCWEWELLLWGTKCVGVGEKWKSSQARQQIAKSIIIP